MVQRPVGVGRFEFVVLCTLRAAQLIKGCRPKVDGIHKATVIAQIEVAEGKIAQVFGLPDATVEAVAAAQSIDVPVAVPAA